MSSKHTNFLTKILLLLEKNFFSSESDHVITDFSACLNCSVIWGEKQLSGFLKVMRK